MNIYDLGFCWLCSMPESYCICEFSDSSWSTSTSQASSCHHSDDEKPAGFVVDGLSADARIKSHYCLGGVFENQYPDFEVDVNDSDIPYSGRGSHRPCAARSSVDDSYTEKRQSPDVIPPPDSSSPVGLGSDSPLFPTTLGPPTLPIDDLSGDRTLNLSCRSRGNGHWHIKVPSELRISATPSAIPLFFHLPTPKFQTQEVAFVDSQGSLDENPYTVREPHEFSADMQGICAMKTRPFTEQTNNPEKVEIGFASTPGNFAPASLKKAILLCSTLLNLEIPTGPDAASSHVTEDNMPHDATTANSDETNQIDYVSCKMPLRKLSAITLALPQPNRGLKRRRSLIDVPLESKKVKLDRTVSCASLASDASIESTYPATKPASIRRAQSLRSEISACSEVSGDSIFYPSPLSSPVNEYAPTVPCTPIPNFVDYARSKANPMVRTVAVYRCGSENIPSVPSIPIIAPPADITPTPVYCAEDYAIVRLKALLSRERSERERDGLRIHDEKRTAGLKARCTTSAQALPRRGSTSTSDSSDGRGHWEDETVIESQESDVSTQNVKILPGPQRLVDREIWSDAFGITDSFRKEITGWILKKLPKEPAPRKHGSRHKRRLGVDLYDQLTNSSQTRFHAAKLFHRYILLPEKAQFWGEVCKYESPERESWKSRDCFSGREGVWDLALACLALSVKLHRDCLPPLGPVFAADFLDMAPHPMTHEAFELAQRDIVYSFEFLLGSCTPQDVLDELWNALPTLRKATESVRDGWATVQCVTWNKLFQTLLEPDMLQFPVTLLTAAALIDGLIFTLARHYKAEAEANVCKCKTPLEAAASKSVPNDIEPTSWQIHLHEATHVVDDVILDVKDVLELSDMELDECRMWMSYACHE